MSVNNCQSFEYKSALVGKSADAVKNTNNFVKNIKRAVPLKYMRKFWRSLEMPLINWKIYPELNWIEDCILSNVGDSAKFKLTYGKLFVLIY